MSRRKRHEINLSLRREIVRGVFPPGRRMPTRVELQERYGVSRQTLQSVMDELAREGFVQPKGIEGTFVSERPPHLSNFGVASPIRFSLSRFLCMR